MLTVYIYLIFVGAFLVLVPSYLPHLRLLRIGNCHSMCHKYVEELVAVVPELKFIKWEN
jgi:hypothetical protein